MSCSRLMVLGTIWAPWGVVLSDGLSVRPLPGFAGHWHVSAMHNDTEQGTAGGGLVGWEGVSRLSQGI